MLHESYCRRIVLQRPTGYESPVTHVRFLNLVSRLNARELSKQTVHHVCVVLRLVCFSVGHKTQFYEFCIGYVVQAEQIGACFFYRAAVRTECVCRHSCEQLSRSVSETFVQVGMQVVTYVTIFLNHGACRFVGYELQQETVAFSRLIICVCQIAYRYTLRTVARSYPVGIGQIDAYRRRRIFVAAEHRRAYHVSRHADNLRLSEARIYGRVVFKPLRILADGLRALRCHHVLVRHNAFPRCLHAEWVAIHFYEAVDKVDASFVLFQPFY